MKENKQIINYNITTGTIFKFFFILIGFVSLWYLQDLIIALLVSVLIASAISPIATNLQKIYIPRSVSVLAVLGSLLGIIFGIVVLFTPVVTSEIKELEKQFPKLQTEVLKNVETYTGADLDIKKITKDTQIKDVTTLANNVLEKTAGSLSNAASAITGFLFQLLLIFVFTFYLAIHERGVENFLRVITPAEKEDYIVNLWNRAQGKIVDWAKGQLILALIMGVTVYIGLKIIGLQNVLLFALLAFVGEFIPMVGMMIATVPAVLIALLTGGTPLAFIVWIFYLVVGQVENHILAPIVVNKIVGVPALIVVISLLVGGTLLGFWGVLLAVPIAAIVMEYINDIESKKKLNLQNIS
jgi:predicted PurR-regulated permease PerM